MLRIETLKKGVKYIPELTMKTLEQCQLRHSGVFILNFDYISPFL